MRWEDLKLEPPYYTPNLGENYLWEEKRKGTFEHDNIELDMRYKAHWNNVSVIVWGHNQFSNINTIITSSWDHSIKSRDVETRNVILISNGSKVAKCIYVYICHNSDAMPTEQHHCNIWLWDMATDKVNSNIGSVTDIH